MYATLGLKGVHVNPFNGRHFQGEAIMWAVR